MFTLIEDIIASNDVFEAMSCLYEYSMLKPRKESNGTTETSS